MKQQPRYYIALPVFIFMLLGIQGCKPRNNFPYDEGNVERNIISIKRAREYTASYRSGVTDLSRRLSDTGFLRHQFQLPVAVQFNKDVLALLLNQKDSAGNNAEGIRMYFARNEQNQVTLVLVPYDRKNNDIIHRLINKNVAFIPGITPAYGYDLDAQAADNALRCPTFCDQANSGLSGTLQF